MGSIINDLQSFMNASKRMSRSYTNTGCNVACEVEAKNSCYCMYFSYALLSHVYGVLWFLVIMASEGGRFVKLYMIVC